MDHISGLYCNKETDRPRPAVADSYVAQLRLAAMHDLSCFAFLLLSGLGIKFMVVLVQGRFSYSFVQISEGLGHFRIQECGATQLEWRETG